MQPGPMRRSGQAITKSNDVARKAVGLPWLSRWSVALDPGSKAGVTPVDRDHEPRLGSRGWRKPAAE